MTGSNASGKMPCCIPDLCSSTWSAAGLISGRIPALRPSTSPSAVATAASGILSSGSEAGTAGCSRIADGVGQSRRVAARSVLAKPLVFAEPVAGVADAVGTSRGSKCRALRHSRCVSVAASPRRSRQYIDSGRMSSWISYAVLRQ